MKGKTLITAIVTTLAISANGQEYKGGLLYDLHGPVKEMKLKTEDRIGSPAHTIKFSDNGMTEFSSVTYDDEGYPYGQDMRLNGKTGWRFKVRYDADRNPIELDYINTVPGNRGEYYFKSEFDGKRVKSRHLTYSNKKKNLDVSYIYSGEKYDSHGNWIERHVSQTTTEKGTSSTVEYDESRTILYFD